MLKTLVLAAAVMAVMGSSAMACNGHKGNKGGAVTEAVPATPIIIVAKA